MRPGLSLSTAALLLSQLLFILPARAAVFPDVPDGHPFQMPIEALSAQKVIGGNPDGTFKPDKPVNRAELLAMLYRASAKTPDGSKRFCFPDAQPGSWYELYVCDAASRGFVKGYEDGAFRPNKEVNRVEALKMITLVMGMQVPEVSGDTSFVTQSDVDFTQWYGKYVLHAFNMSILPVVGMDASRFGPGDFLKRGEAAAYIYNALHATPRIASSSASSSAESSSETAPGRSSRSAQSSSDGTVIRDLSIPSAVTGNFRKKAAAVYRFTLNSPLMLAADVTLTGGASESSVTCRIFKLEDEGFSNEYYLGLERQGGCQLRTKLAAGNYQLEMQPSLDDATYALDVRTAKGDGNDGFSEAKPFIGDSPRNDSLETGDFADWYTFSLREEKKMMIEITNQSEYDCIVYAMGDVDLYGFSGPTCGEEYLFPKGTYYVGIMRKESHMGRVIYSVRVK